MRSIFTPEFKKASSRSLFSNIEKSYSVEEKIESDGKKFICVPEICSDLPTSLKGLEASPKLKSM